MEEAYSHASVISSLTKAVIVGLNAKRIFIIYDFSAWKLGPESGNRSRNGVGVDIPHAIAIEKSEKFFKIFRHRGLKSNFVDSVAYNYWNKVRYEYKGKVCIILKQGR